MPAFQPYQPAGGELFLGLETMMKKAIAILILLLLILAGAASYFAFGNYSEGFVPAP